jgi:hypothetical protein
VLCWVDDNEEHTVRLENASKDLKKGQVKEM